MFSFRTLKAPESAPWLARVRDNNDLAMSRRGVVLSALGLVLFWPTARPAYTQEIAVIVGTTDIKLSPRMAVLTFVASNADTAENAIKTATISAAEGKAIEAVAMKTLPIPVIGSLPVEGVMKVFRKKSQSVKGFYVAFLSGVTAQTALPANTISLLVPAQALQPGQSPVLLRIKPSAKDAARIVRSTKATIKMTGSSINPAATEIHETVQDVVPCKIETKATGEAVVSSNDALGPGEYVIAIAAPPSTTPEPFRVWDFKIVQ